MSILALRISRYLIVIVGIRYFKHTLLVRLAYTHVLKCVKTQRDVTIFVTVLQVQHDVLFNSRNDVGRIITRIVHISRLYEWKFDVYSLDTVRLFRRYCIYSYVHLPTDRLIDLRFSKHRL